MSLPSTEHPFPALQGSSLLGFMAALGTFHTIASQPDFAMCRMKWMPGAGSFYAMLQLPASLDTEELLSRLHKSLEGMADHQIITFEKDLKVKQQDFRLIANDMTNRFLDNHESVGSSMAAAFACDAIVNEDGMIEDTAFRTMSGAGHQHFLEFMNLLAKQTTLEHLREALHGPWRYRDPSPVMRWDDADDRRYALRWDEPSKDPVRTVRGANRLAVAALPLFPTTPTSRGDLATTGFKGSKSNNTFVTWPVWSGWLTLDTARSLIQLRQLQANEPNMKELLERGICAVFRSQRITLGKYRNFTPAKTL